MRSGWLACDVNVTTEVWGEVDDVNSTSTIVLPSNNGYELSADTVATFVCIRAGQHSIQPFENGCSNINDITVATS